MRPSGSAPPGYTGPVKSVRLPGGGRASCLTRPEARAIAAHVDGYFRHGIEVRPGAVVFDVGANIGLFALRVAARTGGAARVYAFEPVPPIRAVLEANAARAGRGAVQVLPWALGAQAGELELRYYPRSPGLSTARPEVWDLAPERLVDTVHGGGRRWGLPRPVARWVAGFLRGKEERHRCQARTLPEARRALGVETIDLLKVDVEGAELEVLQGLGDDPAEWDRVRSAVLEVHDVDGRLEAVCRLLERHGLGRLAVEAEDGFEGTVLRNVYARR